MEYGKRIQMENLKNTRDLGGFPAWGGKRVRTGLLLRSGELFRASERDKELLAEAYRLKKVIDFRTDMERRQRPDPKIGGAEYLANPILDEAALGITHEEKDGPSERDSTGEVIQMAALLKDGPFRYMNQMYENLTLGSYARRQYGRFLKVLAAHDGAGAVLWHCTAGKDRAGTGTAILLSALGVDRSLITEDYMKTNEYYREQNEKLAESVLKRTGNREIAEGAVGLYSVREEYIQRVFEAVEANFGTVKRYLTEGLGMTEREIARLAELYLE